jgi:hypothetical protein
LLGGSLRNRSNQIWRHHEWMLREVAIVENGSDRLE